MSRGKSAYTFSQVPTINHPRSSFDRSHGVKTTFDAGDLVPIFVDEVLPGDTFNLRTAGFARMATPIFPIMDSLILETFYFFVPNRLIWDNFTKMMGEQLNPGDSTDYLVPTATYAPGYDEGMLGDHFGFPIKVPNLTHSALPYRAYKLIYREWFRDQNFQDSDDLQFSTDDGPDDFRGLEAGPFPRNKRHDYFTAALPFPQKGPDVTLNIGTVDVVPKPSGIPFFSRAGQVESGYLQLESGEGNTVNYNLGGALAAPDVLYWRNDGQTDIGLQVDPTATTINEMRTAITIQQMYEIDARSGTRYTEINKAHFGVESPDARLQRPEYLGGGYQPINISEIQSTADTTGNAGRPLASLSAKGTAAFDGHGFTKSFTEHGLIIGLVSVRADLTYQHGLNRMHSRRDRFDYYWPSFANLGEQEILNKELYAQGTAADEETWGYQERYAEYRYKPSEIHGQFRSEAAQTLDAWHLAQDFDALPLLNKDFIREEVPIDRVVATPDEPDFIADFYHKLICARPMPLFAVPGLRRL